MKLRLPNGKITEIHSYSIEPLQVRYLQDDTNSFDKFDEITEFYGNAMYQQIEFLEGDNIIERISFPTGICYSGIKSEELSTTVTESFLVAEEYDEKVDIVTGQDENGLDIIEKETIHHEAQYAQKDILKTIKVITVMFKEPSILEQVADIRNQTGIIDTTLLDLNGWKEYKQEENKKYFTEFLKNASIEFNDKMYGVTEEDQNEMSLNYIQYQIYKAANIDTTLEWHAKKEKCKPFTEESFLTLTMMIKAFVYPYYNLMQEYKEQIYACKSIDEVKAINLVYTLPS